MSGDEKEISFIQGPAFCEKWRDYHPQSPSQELTGRRVFRGREKMGVYMLSRVFIIRDLCVPPQIS
jgi:hypothetical protein